MNKADAEEAEPIIQRMLANLTNLVPKRGLIGSKARTAIGDLKAHAMEYIRADLLGPPLDVCFQLVRESASQPLDQIIVQFEQVRRMAQGETAVTVGGIMIRDNAILLCLAAEAQLLSEMEFTNRADVERVRHASFSAFCYSEETTADAMDQMGYRGVVELHAAITNHFVQTALPLPRVLNYRFAHPFPSLVMAYRLYQDASRADEMRDGNRVIHPAFMPVLGAALSQ